MCVNDQLFACSKLVSRKKSKFLKKIAILKIFEQENYWAYLISHRINHAVLLVGYGTDPDVGDYWVIQNSWGVTWGEKGYMRLARNTLYNCGITSAAIYPVLSD